ncbi:MAG: peptidylprolyl isomerase [Pirellulales bacterium]|nr:peptidylprolyl isomerase [Pirellulales bacterium]
MIFKRLLQRSRGKGKNRRALSPRDFYRHPSFEPLESRQLLSVTLAEITPQTVLGGAPLNLVLNGSSPEGHAISYSVEVSNSQLLSATIPEGNPSLRISVESPGNGIDGDMEFQLFQDLVPNVVNQIMEFVNEGAYNGIVFHRVINNFMIQGGNLSGTDFYDENFRFDDEFNAALQFTSPGLLAMANIDRTKAGSDTNSSEFFITEVNTRHLDFMHSIFGLLTDGDEIREAISNVATTSDRPDEDVVMTEVSIFTDTQKGVLRLSAPNASTDTVSVTVTATDNVTQESVSRTFQVNIVADTTNDPAFLGPIDPIQTSVNTPVDFNLPGIDVEGDELFYGGNVVDGEDLLTLTVDESTGEATLTPDEGVIGVYSIRVGVASDTNNAYDIQMVPVYINPAAPTGLTLLAASDTGSSNSDRLTNLNNTDGKTLQFRVDGVLSGITVGVYADDVLIGQHKAESNSVTITTDGTTILTDGAHSFTAKQILEDQAVDVGNLHATVDLVSESSPALSVTIDATPPEFNFTPVTEAEQGVLYQCQVTTTESEGIAFQLNHYPEGMTIDSATGLISWTPGPEQGGTKHVVVQATDPAGNAGTTTFDVSLPNIAPVLVPAQDVQLLGSATEDGSAVTIPLTDFIVNGNTSEDPTKTTITDDDPGAVVGGIALLDATGNGTWQYSLDGSTFASVGDVSSASALLLPHDAVLRFVPNGENGGTAVITYRAWDLASEEQAGEKANTTNHGGRTAFSTATDSAEIAVSDLNDAPVLTVAHPSLGTLVPGVDTIISLDDFINNGSGTTIINDVDQTNLTGGIALVGAVGEGIWKYSLNGTTFTSVGTVSETSSLLLPPGATLSYTAGGSDSIAPSITYRAWDGSSGQSGDVADTSVNGGTTAFSAAADTASMTLAIGSLSGYVYIDANNDGLRGCSNGTTHLALPGVTVRLFSQNNQGAWVAVPGKSPVVSAADGAYRFEGLAPGLYRIEEVHPTNYLDGKETPGTVAGAVRGTAGNDSIEVQLGGGEDGVEYNFGERGLRPEMISMAFFLASSTTTALATPPYNAPVNTAPAVDLSASASGTGYSTTFATGGSPVAIAAADAAITDTTDSTLTSMTATITNPLDGNSEKLAAAVSNTSITSNYSGGVLALTGVASIADYQQILRSITYENTADAPQIGSRTINVVVSDGTVASPPAASTVTVTDGPTPSGYTITTDDDLLNASEAKNTGFTFADAEVGATYRAVVTGGGSSVSYQGTITSATQHVTGLDVSSLPNGTITFSVTLTNTAGNTGRPAQDTTQLDQTPPEDYSVVANAQLINATEAYTTVFTLYSDGEEDVTYQYSVTSDGGEGEVTADGSVTSTKQYVTGVNVSSLPDGAITYTVTLTDKAGNTGAPQTATATLDTTPPTGYAIQLDADAFNAITAKNTGFTLTAPEFEGVTYSYTVSSNASSEIISGTDVVDATSMRLTGIDVSSLPEGTLTYSVILTDAAGNSGSPFIATATLDTTPPSGFLITPDDLVVDESMSYLTGFTFVNAEPETTCTYFVTSNNGSGEIPKTKVAILSSDQNVGPIDLSAFDGGYFQFYATLTDAAGNESSLVTAEAYIEKTLST